MASLVQSVQSVVAPPSEISAAESFSQSSTRVEKPSDAPAAAASQPTTVAAPAAPPVETGQAKPPPPRAADGSIAAGSPAEKAEAPPKRAPLVAAPLLDPPRTYEKDAKTIRALISLEDGPGLLVVAPADATVADVCRLCQPRVEKRFGKDASLALKMKRAVCPNPEIDACHLEQLPDDYSPLEADECAICEAVVADLFGIVQQTRDRPKKKLGDNYVRLLGLMGSVCEELPMRHPIRAKERDAVLELCQDIWEDHDSTLYQMAMKRSADFARTMCSQQLELCDDDVFHVC